MHLLAIIGNPSYGYLIRSLIKLHYDFFIVDVDAHEWSVKSDGDSQEISAASRNSLISSKNLNE